MALPFWGCGRAVQKSAARTVAVERTVRTRLANSMTLQAEFYPFQDVMLHAKVSGYVNPIRVDIGDKVASGDLLATLEVPELKDQLEGALASERRAKTEHDIVHLNYQRLVEVNKDKPNLVAQQDLDDAQSKDAAAEAALGTAKADADRYSSLSSYTRITAPFAGVITKRFVDNGSLVEAGTSGNAGPVVELVEDDRLRLRFPVPEAETGVVKVGGKVDVAVDALDRNFNGVIARDSWDIDRSTRTMVVEVDVPNTDGLLKAGMYATVTLPVTVANAVLAVPLQALSLAAEPTVLVVAGDGVIAERKVVVGLRTASLAEIRSGLLEGDLVIVGDRSGLVPGTVVIPKILEASGSE
ncbi:MAG TPA: efflux RND transporter periplasmic adaptor subunit [Opitutaceae bacterium]|jgi:RND family efflux transporter MFP subunit|nr:efflux RND transporter periplasmic adaptor subunit [Opitutaceae bacterium]